jgi:hypothetical protein
MSARDAKAMAREVDSKDVLVAFNWKGKIWKVEPKTWFYDWLYLSAVTETHPRAIGELRQFDGFTDIEFNPAKSFNCQARSCAIIASTNSDADVLRLVHYPESMVVGSAPRTDPPASQARLF